MKLIKKLALIPWRWVNRHCNAHLVSAVMFGVAAHYSEHGTIYTIFSLMMLFLWFLAMTIRTSLSEVLIVLLNIAAEKLKQHDSPENPNARR